MHYIECSTECSTLGVNISYLKKKPLFRFALRIIKIYVKNKTWEKHQVIKSKTYEFSFVKDYQRNFIKLFLYLSFKLFSSNLSWCL